MINNCRLIELLPQGCLYVNEGGFVECINNPAASIFGRFPENIAGCKLSELIPGLDIAKNYNLIDAAIAHAESATHDFISPVDETWWRLTATGIYGGAMIIFTSIAGLSSKKPDSYIALLLSEERFRSFVEGSSDMVYRMSADWKDMQILVGKDFLADSTSNNGGWMEAYIPEEDRGTVWSVINRAIENKEIFKYEHRVIQAGGSIGWTLSRAIPRLDQQGEIIEWIGTASNINIRKKTELALQNFNTVLEDKVTERTAELKESRNAIESIFNTSLIAMSLMEPVYKGRGEIADFKISIANRHLEQMTGRTDLAGKLYLKEYPGVVPVGLFNMMLRVMATGKAEGMEYAYDYEGYHQWFSCMFVKSGDALVATNIDITARKEAEEERVRNYTLLQQSEQLAATGSWDYDPTRGSFTWSDGMYRLFNLEKGKEVEPAIYTKYATPESMPAAERVVAHLLAGDQEFEETLELKINGRIKVIHLKATVVKNDSGTPVRVLGVDLDITAIREAESKLRHLDAIQQQEIFKITLNTQEAERRRIAESLHNGVGQSLYATALALGQLTVLLAAKNADFNKSKAYVVKLLGDAINDVRRISHELMPSILVDCGIEAAIRDICYQLDVAVHFNCEIHLNGFKLDHYMEVAIYRTVQELMMNVVKHAKATRADVIVRVTAGEVVIIVRDNGQGMPLEQLNKSGIGLSSIRNNVMLLKGIISIEPGPLNGTEIKIHLPYRISADSHHKLGPI
jgi:signal transduction histidine kinase